MNNNEIVKTLIFTPKFKIEGLVHLPFRDSYRGRLSDHLNSGRMPVFIPLTEAKVFDLNGKLLYDIGCVIVNRHQIETIIELEDDS